MKYILTTLVALILTLQPLQAADEVSFGYVDMQKVFESSKGGQQAEAGLKKAFESEKERLGKEEQALRQLQDQLTRDQALMSEEQVEKKQQEIQGRTVAFQRLLKTAQDEMQQRQMEVTKELLIPAAEAAEEIAKEKGVRVVFEKNQAGILFLDPSLDLTEDVIKRVDSKLDTQ